MIEKITLSNIQAHQSEPAYQFLMQTLNDLWENYMYNQLLHDNSWGLVIVMLLLNLVD